MKLLACEVKFETFLAFFNKKKFTNLVKLSLQILKLSLARKNWLLKSGLACSLAQNLEPKLLIYEILKFAWHSLDIQMHATR